MLASTPAVSTRFCVLLANPILTTDGHRFRSNLQTESVPSVESVVKNRSPFHRRNNRYAGFSVSS